MTRLKAVAALAVMLALVLPATAGASQFYVDGSPLPEGQNQGILEYGSIYVRGHLTKARGFGEPIGYEFYTFGPCSYTAGGRVYNSAGVGHLEVRNTDGICTESPYVGGNGILQYAAGVGPTTTMLEGDKLVGPTQFRIIEAGSPPSMAGLFTPIPTGSMQFNNPSGGGLALIDPGAGAPQFSGGEVGNYTITGNLHLQGWSLNPATNMPRIVTSGP